MHRPLVPKNHAKSTETQGNAAKIVFMDLNDWQHRPKPLAPRAKRNRQRSALRAYLFSADGNMVAPSATSEKSPAKQTIVIRKKCIPNQATQTRFEIISEHFYRRS
jgi:hypothetical protein